MKIQWFEQEVNSSAVTIYDNNVTLSKQASNYLSDAYGIQVGFDVENQTLILKKVTKDDVNKQYVNHNQLYTLTIKQSFGRINSKKLILELQKYVNLDFTHQKSYKYNARYNNGQKMLIVDIKEAINNA